LTAAVLRFWQLGQRPPGLYRDEAYNGLDALKVLEGQHALFFSRNNGREPSYIYLTALSISIFGRTPLALRLAAAVIGTLTTWLTYQLASTWFGWRVGLLAAWLWAVTVWPLHLGRIGLRVGLLPAALALLFWLGTLAYRRQDKRFWLAAGLVYGAAWYTYLAVRFTPLLLLAFLLYLIVTGRRNRLWPGLAWFVGGALVVIAPLALLAWQQPQIILGRSNQVSILNPAINGGDFLGALWQHSWQALGLFFWRGDTILRHNPAGRPLFDPLMAIPFLLGVFYCLRQWRRPAAAALLLWTAVMLGPTILAEDTPHFLRAAGILPAALLFPALGLSQLGSWTTLPGRWAYPALPAGLLAASLLAASFFLTVRDYFIEYNQQPATAYLFETAARDLAEQVNGEAEGVTIFLEQRLWDGWPSVQFLLKPERSVTHFQLEAGLPAAQPPAAIYLWPHQNLDDVAAAINPPALVMVAEGSLARGDLEAEAYPLYVRYGLSSLDEEEPVLANFNNQLQLRRVAVTAQEPLQVDLYWSGDSDLEQPVVAFVHLLEDGRLVAQNDAPPGLGYWPQSGWQPGLVVQDRHEIEMGSDYDPGRHQLYIGLYDAVTQVRLPVLDQAGRPVADSWLLPPGGPEGE
jgi:4-amino-4-deoxy-L-arabinose transferase-like glycosyltransferase